MKKITRDYWPTKQWQSADPKLLGIEGDKISQLDDFVKKEYKNINSVVVVRHGYIVYQKYYHGYGPNETQQVASVTKSVISALIGICIDKGYLTSVEQKVMDFFPEYKSSMTDTKKLSVTLKQLLTMTAPFAFSMKSADDRPLEPLDRLRRQRDWVKYILELMGTRNDAEKFQYSTSGIHLLSAIITRITGMSACAFANEHLFKPIGMQSIPDQEMKSFRLKDVFGEKLSGWIKDPQGNNVGGWGISLSPHDMARLGFLYLNKGLWENRQVISSSWIDDTTAPNANNYGYLWWLDEAEQVKTFAACGDGSNMINCIPEKDLILVTTGNFVTKPPDPRLLIKKCILPAIMSE